MQSARSTRRRRVLDDDFGMVAYCAALTALCAVVVAAAWTVCLYAVTGVVLSSTSRGDIEGTCKGSLAYDYLIVCMCLTLLPICVCALSCIISEESRFRTLVTRSAVALCFGCACTLVPFGMYELVGRGCQKTALVHWRVFFISCLWVATQSLVTVLSVVFWVRNRHSL